MAFFEPPLPPPSSPRPERRPWWGPPDNLVGASVALGLVVGHSEKAAITLGAATAYPSGFEFGLGIRARDDLEDFLHGPPWMIQRLQRSSEPLKELPPELLRYGVEFADGTKATSIQPHPFAPPGEEQQLPTGPLLLPGGGGGGGSRWEQSCWIWPLPPEGPLAFVCEWPVAG